MKKKFLSIILTLTMLVTMIPMFGITASATPEGTLLTNNGGELTGGTYYLDSDLVLDTNITINKNTVVTIDLNGYILKGNGSGSVITNKGTLTIKDSNAENSHYFNTSSGEFVGSQAEGTVTINGGVITGGVAESGGAINSVGDKSSEKASLYIEGGNFVYNKATSYGGAIYCGKKTNVCSISGGVFKYNEVSSTSDDVYGGAIHVQTGTATIKNIIISNNTAKTEGASKGANGGGLSVGKDVDITKIEGIKVSLNEALATGAATKSYGGGIMFVKNSNTPVKTTEISNCEIKNNKVETSGGSETDSTFAYGGGVFNGRDLNLTGNTIISGNIAKVTTSKNGETTRQAFGGGVSITKNAKLTIAEETVQIMENRIDSSYKAQGGGVYMESSSEFTMTAGSITGNAIKAYKDSEVNEEEGGGLCVTYASSKFTVGGTAIIYGNKDSAGNENNVYLRKKDNAKIIVSTAEGKEPAAGMKIGIFMLEADDDIIEGITKDNLSYFTPDNGEYLLKFDETNSKISILEAKAKIGTLGYETLQDAVNAAKTGDTVILLSDDSSKVVVNAEKTFVLDTNGKTFTGKISPAEGYSVLKRGNTYKVIESNGITIKINNSSFTINEKDISSALANLKTLVKKILEFKFWK